VNVDLPAIVRSSHTWDTSGPGDLRQGEEAIVVSATEEWLDNDQGGTVYTEWMLIPLGKPRLVRLHVQSSIDSVLRKWLRVA
jgi:hypothetical protein